MPGKVFRLVVLGMLLAALAPASAGALTRTIGQTGTDPAGGCSSCTTFQSQSSGAGYAATWTVPKGSWSITSWEIAGGTTLQGDMRLAVFRPTAVAGQYQLIDVTSFVPVPAGVTSTFAAYVPVMGGDLLGLQSAANAGGAGNVPMVLPGVPGEVITNVQGAQPGVGILVGTGGQMTATQTDMHLNLAATLYRPDIDTTITARPKGKSRKRRVSFSFTANVFPVSGFECEVDKQPFAPCTSPVTYKLKPGKHSFEVRATDDGGFVDTKPASASFKITPKKKARKKKH
jgi:hypothetical protein